MPKLTPKIRRAVLSDVAEIAKIHVQSWQAAYRGQVPDLFLNQLTPRSWYDKWNKHLKDPGYETSVLEIDGQMAGFVCYGPCDDEECDPVQTAEIKAIYLAPEYWHQGLGKILSQTALEKLSADKYHDVILWVLSSNQNAHRFYEALGFAAEKEIQNAERIPGTILNEVRYRKKL